MVIPRTYIQNPGEELVHLREAEPESRFVPGKAEMPVKYPTRDV